MIALNNHLFLLLNASAKASFIVVGLATVLANDLIYLVPLLLVGLWVWATSDDRAGLLATSVMAALALFANQVVGQFWYEPRPFMIGLGRTLLNHAPENSFPSDHTTLIVSVGVGLMATAAARRIGVAVIAVGILVGWARVYLGLHFPIDIISSRLIAVLFGAVAAQIEPALRSWIVPSLERIYDRMLDATGLPDSLFPRAHLGD
jgi:undecaprenyl-diphosphatase